MKHKILAIIPARGGSKGIPQKNIRLLAGKPLIAYTIEAALHSKFIDRLLVSTEDDEIVKISKMYGADVIKRPLDLASDDSPTIDTIFHLLKVMELQKEYFDLVINLQPTSPLRSSNDIDCALEFYLKNDYESVISVCETQHSAYWSYNVEGGYLKPIFGRKYLCMRRQDLPKSYLPNGAIYISTPQNLKIHSGFNGSKIGAWIMPPERSIDIDSMLDFDFAEFLIKRSNK